MRSLPVVEGAGQLTLPGVAAPPAWRTLDERERGTAFVELPVRSVLNGPETTGLGFWSVNPYVGCEFGCTYCYARATHRYAVERAHAGGLIADADLPAFRGEEGWEGFERRVLVKRDAARALVRSLEPKRIGDASLVIGSATDPYQPAERVYGVTRSILQALLGWRGLSIGIITKSPLVARDAGLLARLAERHEVHVNLSLMTMDAALARRLELRSPAPHARIRALERLRAAGVPTGLLAAPVVPLLTDGRDALRALLAAARDAGAEWAWASALRLNAAARARFLPFMDREFPDLAARYRRHFGARQNADRAYQDALDRRFAGLQEELGFTVKTGMRRRRQVEGPAAQAAADPSQPSLL